VEDNAIKILRELAHSKNPTHRDSTETKGAAPTTGKECCSFIVWNLQTCLLFQRLECPHCGNQDQDALDYFTNDDGRYRLYVCERCKGYLKAIDLRQTESEVLLPLERLLTLQFDMQAQEQGYSPRGEVDTDGKEEGQSG